jgi:hypothetical protein
MIVIKLELDKVRRERITLDRDGKTFHDFICLDGPNQGAELRTSRELALAVALATKSGLASEHRFSNGSPAEFDLDSSDRPVRVAIVLVGQKPSPGEAERSIAPLLACAEHYSVAGVERNSPALVCSGRGRRSLGAPWVALLTSKNSSPSSSRGALSPTTKTDREDPQCLRKPP